MSGNTLHRMVPNSLRDAPALPEAGGLSGCLLAIAGVGVKLMCSVVPVAFASRVSVRVEGSTLPPSLCPLPAT